MADNQTTITFRVYGTPKPGGSKRSFIPGAKAGMPFDPKLHRAVVVEDSKHNKVWRESVKTAALDVAPKQLLTGALKLTVVFLMPRIQGHFRSGKNAHELKPAAPRYHTVKPDATKLLRSTEDALTGVLWRDDATIAEQHVSKVYTSGRCGAIVTVEELTDLIGEVGHAN